MKRGFTVAGIGALLILIAAYLFPFGQDLFMLWMTKELGSQVAAWTALYFICFVLLLVGYFMGGARILGIRRLAGIFKLLLTRPLFFAAIVVIMFIMFLIVSNVIGG